MKFLITGITGFAGPHLANLLHNNGHKVYGLIRNSNGMENDIRDVVLDETVNNITFLCADLNNYRIIQQILKDNKFDGIFHLAAQSHPPTSFIDPLGTFNDNIMGSANLIQAITDHQPECVFMFCSTSEVYGNIGIDGRKINNNDKILPANPYGASKAAMQEPVLKVGNLESVRVVLDVRDTVNAYYLAMIKELESGGINGQIFNVCGDTPHKMKFFTDKLLEISKLNGIEQQVCPKLYRPIDIHYQHGDYSNLLELTNWKPTISIDKTMSDLLNYWMFKIN